MKEQTFTYDQVIALLDSQSPKCEAVFIVLSVLGEASTSQVAKALGWDRSNTGRRLEALAEDGRILLVDEAFHAGERGRPTRLWSVK
jgi:predicted ArsR family transcriptional regulator